MTLLEAPTTIPGVPHSSAETTLDGGASDLPFDPAEMAGNHSLGRKKIRDKNP